LFTLKSDTNLTIWSFEFVSPGIWCPLINM
jgi:hypothetical protein